MAMPPFNAAQIARFLVREQAWMDLGFPRSRATTPAFHASSLLLPAASDTSTPIDPWGRAFHFRSTPTSFPHLRSALTSPARLAASASEAVSPTKRVECPFAYPPCVCRRELDGEMQEISRRPCVQPWVATPVTRGLHVARLPSCQHHAVSPEYPHNHLQPHRMVKCRHWRA